MRSGAIDFGYIPAAQYNQRKAVEDKGYQVFLWPGNSITYLALNFYDKAPRLEVHQAEVHPPGHAGAHRPADPV